MYLCIELFCTATTDLYRVIWINRVRLPNLLVVSSTGKLSVLVDVSVVSTYYIHMYWSVQYCCLYYLFIYTFVHGSLLYMHICVTAVVCMYVCMVIANSKGKNQPGEVANPTRGQLAEQGR